MHRQTIKCLVYKTEYLAMEFNHIFKIIEYDSINMYKFGWGFAINIA